MNPLFSDIDLVIVAAGRGERLNAAQPKALVPLLGKRLIDWTLENLAGLGWDSVTVVAPDEFDTGIPCMIVGGGTTRAQSVQNGVSVGTAPYVVIHDAARPFTPIESLEKLCQTIKEGAISASLASPVADTLTRGDGERVDRRDLWALQTPQGFERIALGNAFNDLKNNDFTDETALIQQHLDLYPTLIPSSSDNFKITYPDDLKRAERLLLARHSDTRTGFGYDVHRFTDGDFVTLGGVRISHNRGILAHSDGDVILHALSDALYGTIADHDIGHHFPPNKAHTENMDSRDILKAAGQAVAAKGGVISHIDVMVLAEAPKLSPHRDAIRQSIADTLFIDISKVSVKATTMETLGFIGREEGLAAQAVVTCRFSV